MGNASTQVFSNNHPTNTTCESNISSDFDPGKLNGIFEIHITIHPNGDYTKLLRYIYDHRTERKFKVVFAVSGTNNQYMLSYFTRKDSDEAVIKSAKQTAENLERNNIRVSRVKVECHDLRGLPQTDQDYAVMDRYLNLKYKGELTVDRKSMKIKIETVNYSNSKKPYFSNLIDFSI